MKNVPELRFAGFDGEWEEKKFSEKFNTTIPKNSLSRDKLTNEPTKIKNIHYGDIHKVFNNYVNSSNDFIPYIIDDDIPYYERYLLHDGDIVFADAAEDNTAGKCVELDIDDNSNIVAGLHTIPARPNQSGKYFFGFYLNSSSFHNKIIPLLEGTKVSSISKTNLNTLSVVVPEIDEQEKIGSLFKKISALIEKQEDKVSKIEDFKKSMLQKTFPKKGELVPEIRFKGFTENWEIVKLGHTGELSAGGDIDKSKIQKGGNYPVIANGDSNSGIVGYYDDEFKIQGPAITISARGNIGTATYRNYNFTPVVRLITLKTNNNYYFMTTLINTINIINESTGVSQLTIPQIGSYKIKIPSLPEQEKIGNFFKNLDAQIETEKKLLDSYKMMKKSLLQKMFV